MDKFICVGKNYVEHAKELGDPVPESPVLFLKPPSVGLYVTEWGETIEAHLPKNRGDVHFECEIILRLNSDSKIESVSLGLDMTLRSVQSNLKAKGHPWEVSKVFPESAIVGPWIPIDEYPDFLKHDFSFSVDGVVKQKAKGHIMQFSPEECIQYAHTCFPVKAGDIVFTGTPAGVGPVYPGQEGKVYWGEKYQYRIRFF